MCLARVRWHSHGPGVTTFKVGTAWAWACLVGSCSTARCASPATSSEVHLDAWSPVDLPRRRRGNPTTGGYSRGFTVRRTSRSAYPVELDFAACAPLLCAGITTYSPLKHYNVGPGARVAITGLGGLGHVGVQIAKAMGADVSVISHGRSRNRRAASVLTLLRDQREGLSSLRGFLPA